MTPLDTSPYASELQIEVLRKLLPGQRLKIAVELLSSLLVTREPVK
jgi:hypothetical protein